MFVSVFVVCCFLKYFWLEKFQIDVFFLYFFDVLMLKINKKSEIFLFLFIFKQKAIYKKKTIHHH
jgi:hypothetical protein